MFDTKKLLGSVLQAGLARSGPVRVRHAVGPDGEGGVLGNVLRELKAGNPKAIGGVGALAGALLGGRRGGAVQGAVGGGALALLGSLAYEALRKSGATTPGAEGGSARPIAVPPELTAPEGEASEAVLRGRALVLLQAMINAAKADGQIDAGEMERIMGRLDEAEAEPEAKEFVLAELRRPLDLDALVARVDGLDLAAEVYAASLLAIEIDTDAERAYLRNLATRLNLGPDVVRNLHAHLAVSPPR